MEFWGGCRLQDLDQVCSDQERYQQEFKPESLSTKGFIMSLNQDSSYIQHLVTTHPALMVTNPAEEDHKSQIQTVTNTKRIVKEMGRGFRSSHFQMIIHKDSQSNE